MTDYDFENITERIITILKIVLLAIVCGIGLLALISGIAVALGQRGKHIMLTFPLKKEWYEKIKSGEKTVEYREVKPYWTRRLERAEFRGGNIYWDFNKTIFENFSAPCFFRLGYTKERLEAWITKIEVVDGKDTDLHIDKPVYAIHFKDVREGTYLR